MNDRNNSNLYDQEHSVDFYESRYEKGYMDEWHIAHKKKIFQIIGDLKLPPTGEALDFGCGNGVLTEIVRQALPSWTVSGTDISLKALDNARRRFPKCIFFDSSSQVQAYKKYDFVFTNHVFEHVYNLNDVFNRMNDLLKPKSAMLHLLPCGNVGSYEFNSCLLRKDGVNAEMENRFFFEDEGHVRRLTTDQFRKLCEKSGFELKQAFYSNQHYGAINWITNSGIKFIVKFTDPLHSVDGYAKMKLYQQRIFLSLIALARLHVKKTHEFKSIPDKHVKHYLILLLSPFLLATKRIDRYWIEKAQSEWDTKRLEPNGSEMFLYFER